MKKDKQLQKLINKLVEKGFVDGKIIENQVTKAIKFLKSLPRTDAIWALSEYLKLLRRKEREHTMYIETTIPLSTEQIKKAKKIVERKVNPSVTLRVNGERSQTIKITKVLVNINPEILGGFKLRIGDEIWDESILGKIQKVKEAIISGRSNPEN